MARALRHRTRALLAVAVALTPLLFAGLPLPVQVAADTTCAQLAAAEPQTGHTMPPQANTLFAPDFSQLTDCEWGYPLGGWGGVHQAAALHHTPIIFVHGNQADAENWYLVADELKSLAGYTDQEMYAI